MSSRIFKSIIFVASTVLLLSLVIVTLFSYRHYGSIQEEQLKTALQLVAEATEQGGDDYLKQLNQDRYRITLIAKDGTVVFDNREIAGRLDNHAEREEIKSAFELGQGSSKRYSDTLTEQTFYEALRLSDGRVLRLSISRDSIFTLVFDMLHPLLVVLFISILISAFLANKVAKWIAKPLNNLNLAEPLTNDTYEEISPLLKHIHSQQLEIKERISILQQKQDTFDQITKNMKEALVLLDRRCCVVTLNESAKTLLSADENCLGQDFMMVYHNAKMQRAIKEAKVQGRAELQIQINGKDYQFDLSRIDSDAKMQGLVILAFDITDQVHAQKHRQAFTANVSHELKTPLQTILGSAELIEQKVVKSEDIPRFMGLISKEASRLLSLIEDVIHLAKLDEGIEMPFENVHLQELIEEARDALLYSANSKDISIEINGEEGHVYGVRVLLYEIIYNLLDNAIKYNVKGGTVKISIAESNSYVILTVKDSGIGISLEHQEKVFERFYRVDQSHSKQSGGTGLGLSIVKHAVQHHHGRISLQSELGKGTTIEILFPKNETSLMRYN